MSNKKHDKEQLLQIGQKLFREKGYHNTGTEEILEKADYPRSSFYYHFKNKEGFGVEAVRFYSDRLKEFMSTKFMDSRVASPWVRVKNYFFDIAEFGEDCGYTSACLVQRFSMDSALGEGKLKEAAGDELRCWHRLVEPLLVEAQDKGEIRRDIAVQSLAEILFVGVFGSYATGKLADDVGSMRENMKSLFRLIET